ncbi:Staygreen protein [anaerobic digester metagenome]
MENLNPEKPNVEFRQGVTTEEPIINRRYTLTHSDITAELFLTIGLEYAYDKINMMMRDEVLGEWRDNNGRTYLYIYVYVNGQFGSIAAEIRNMIFRRELPLALEAIRYGDREFFEAHPELDDAAIWVHFDSTTPQYDKFEYWGTPKDYK